MYRFLFSIEVQRCVQIIKICSSVSTINRYANFTSVCKLIIKIFTLLCFQYKAHTNRSFTIKIRLLINDVLLAFARRHKPFKRFAHDVQHVATLDFFFHSFFAVNIFTFNPSTLSIVRFNYYIIIILPAFDLQLKLPTTHFSKPSPSVSDRSASSGVYRSDRPSVLVDPFRNMSFVHQNVSTESRLAFWRGFSHSSTLGASILHARTTLRTRPNQSSATTDRCLSKQIGNINCH